MTQDSHNVRSSSSHHGRRAKAIVLLLLALHHFGFKIMYLPLNRVMENRICHNYYSIHDPLKIPTDGIVPEKLCKLDDVQKELAALFGTTESLHLFIGVSLSRLMKPKYH